MLNPVKLPRNIVNQLLHYTQQNSDSEICGLISCKDDIPIRCYPITNVADNPQQLFALDPAQQIAAMRKMRDHNEQLFAIYHSHPSSPAIPSIIDLEQVNYPDALYLIISLQTRGVLEMRGFYLREKKIIEAPLQITE